MSKEIEIKNWFTIQLIGELGYGNDNLIFEKRIEKNIIDLLIIDNESIDFKPLALVEFKSIHTDFDSALSQVKIFLRTMDKACLPAFLVHGHEVYVLQSYGWQKIDINDFPILQSLKQQHVRTSI